MADGWEALCTVADLERTGRVTRWIGASEVTAFKEEGTVHVVRSICPHAGGPLGEGKILPGEEGPSVRCPWHGYVFGLANGACADHPALSISRLPFRIESGSILVQPPATLMP